MIESEEHGRGRPGSPAGDPRIAVGGIPHQRQPIRYGARSNAELADHPILVQDDVTATVPADDAHPRDQLCQVLVRRADHDLLHAGLVLQAERTRCQGIVGLELHHGPDHNAQRGNSSLCHGELSQQVRVDAGARLVSREEIVAEGLDDVVEGAGDMRHAGRGDERHETPEKADGGADLPAVWALSRRRAEVVAKELIGAVDQMDLHCSIPALQPLLVRPLRA